LPTTPGYQSIWELPTSEISARLMLGGILAMIAGILAVIQGLLFVMTIELFGDPFGGAATLCGITKILFGALSVAGGTLALNRTSWRLAFVCSFFGVLGLGFLVGALIGGVAMVAVVVSREEFR